MRAGWLGFFCVFLSGCGAAGGSADRAIDGRTVDLRPAPRPGVVYEILHREKRQVDDEAPRTLQTRTLAEVLEVRPDGSRAMRARIWREYRGSDDEPQLQSGIVRFVLTGTGRVEDAEVACGDDAELRVSRYLAHVLGARAFVARDVGEGSRWRAAYLSDAIELESPATFQVDRLRGRRARGRIAATLSLEEGDVGGLRVSGEGRIRGRFEVDVRDGFSGRTELQAVVRGQIRDEGGATRRGRLRTRSQILVRPDSDELVDGTFDCAFDPAIVTRFIRDHIRAVQTCYETELARDPTLSGRLLLRFTIRPDGHVEQVTVPESTLGSENVAGCMRRLVDSWRFPVGPVGGSVTFAYPFVFAPQQ